MFEYVSLKALVIVVLINIAVYIITFSRKKRSYKMLTASLFLLTLVFIYAWRESNSAKESITDFKSQKVLKCSSGGGAYSNPEVYKVSSRDGWKLYKGEFVKDSLIVQPNRCEIW